MQKRIVFGALAAVLAVFLGGVGMALAQIPITECGQVIPRGQTGELTQDLTCPDAPGMCSDYSRPCDTDDDCPRGSWCDEPAGVYLESGATVNMNGFAIDSEGSGVACRPQRCTILGPGVIRAAQWGVRMLNANRASVIEISDILIDGSRTGILSGWGKVFATSLTIQNCWGYGMFAGKLLGSDIAVNDSGLDGIFINWPGSIIADNVTVNGNASAGIYNDPKVKGSNITANLNGSYGIVAHSIVATGVETKGNAMGGVSSRRIARITGLASMNNAGPGLESQGHVMLLDSTLSDNDASGDGIDILSTRQPRLSNTTCSRSERMICEPRSWDCTRTGESWGVCSLD